jgi:hypothetical protein
MIAVCLTGLAGLIRIHRADASRYALAWILDATGWPSSSPGGDWTDEPRVVKQSYFMTASIDDAMKGANVMMPYDSYRLYEIERTKSPVEVQRADEQAAVAASAASSLFRGIAQSLRVNRGPFPAGTSRLASPGLTD